MAYRIKQAEVFDIVSREFYIIMLLFIKEKRKKKLQDKDIVQIHYHSAFIALRIYKRHISLFPSTSSI
jgi:hypothetical protein